MNKAIELKTTANIVKYILTKIPETRNSDNFLYFKVCERINPEVIYKPFHIVILNRKEYKFPSFETVRRTRQKLQAEFPELSGNNAVKRHRKNNEEVFRDYARKGGRDG